MNEEETGLGELEWENLLDQIQELAELEIDPVPLSVEDWLVSLLTGGKGEEHVA